MAIIKCKICGGDMEISADKTFGTCECCGCTMTLPKIDDDQKAASFNRGNHFRRTGEFDKALQVYERIIAEDDNDAEAHWCAALCRFGIEWVEDPATLEYLPTCHRLSFDLFTDDVDYLAALEHSDGITKRQYQKDAAKIVEVQRGVLATSQNEKPFDVFICYKESDENGQRTIDSTLAQEIYYQLTDQGLRVFFARITLEDKAGSEYEPYIFAALNSAKAMVVVGTKPEYFNAVWVKNEWSRYLSLVKRERNKVLLPCYRDMDPYDLPEQLAVLQSYDMTKIGFIQDLIRGIKKIAGADDRHEQHSEAVMPGVAVQASVEPLLKRAFLFLEDGDWKKADEFCEQVLNQDPENARAYLGKLMADMHVANQTELVDAEEPFDDNYNYNKVLRFGDDSLINELKRNCETIRERVETNRLEGIYSSALNLMQLNTPEAFQEASDAFESISVYKDAAELAETCLTRKRELNLTSIYLDGEAAMEEKPELALEYFSSIPEWKDAAEKAEECKRLIKEREQEAIYQQARDKESADPYQAYELYSSIPECKDSSQRAEDCHDIMRRVDLTVSTLWEYKSDKVTQQFLDDFEQLKNDYRTVDSELKHNDIEIKDVDQTIKGLSLFNKKEKQKHQEKQQELSNQRLMLLEKRNRAYQSLRGFSSLEQVKTAFSQDKKIEAQLKNLGVDLSQLLDIETAINNLKDQKVVAQIQRRYPMIQSLDTLLPMLCFGRHAGSQIEWLVVCEDADKKLLVSRRVLDVLFDAFSSDGWAASRAKEWLNNEFFMQAFDESERARILEHQPAGCRVFLLDEKEARQYLPSYGCYPTEHAVKMGVVTDENRFCDWWLRSKGESNGTIMAVSGNMIQTAGFWTLRKGVGIRPAMWVSK